MAKLSSFLMLAAASGAMAGAQTPDLSGTWKLNTTASYFGGEHPAPNYQLIKNISVKGDVITVTDTQVHRSRVNIPLPDSKVQMEFTPDGKEYAGQAPGMFPGMPPVFFTVATEWQGGTLLIRRVGNSSASVMNSRMRFYLSPDGSRLIELVDSHILFGDTEQRLVFDRAR